jgi:TolA-binding protein
VNMRYALFLLLAFLVAGVTYAQDPLSQQKAERLYAKGRELVDHNNFGAARQIFSEFLAVATPTDTRRSEAQYYVAFSALNLGHEDGEKLIDNFIENNPSSPRASTAFYDLAIFFYNEKNYPKASRYFKKVEFPALTFEQQGKGHFSWGYSLFSQKKLDEALVQFNFVKTQGNSYSPAASYYAGYVEYANGIYPDALEDLKRAEINPSYAAIVPYLIANVYYRQQRYDELINYAGALKDRGNLANRREISMLVAEAYYFKGDFKSAVAAYEKYFQDGNPGKAESPLLFRAGYAYYTLGQEDKAIGYLKESAASSDSVSYYASYYLGIMYLKHGDKPYALNAFNYAKNYTADKRLSEESSFQFAKVAYDAGKADMAISELESFLNAFPSSAHQNEVKELLAQAYVNGNNYNKAIAYIESLPQKNTSMQQAYQKATYLKGSELFNKEDYPQAVLYFEKSLSYPIDQAYVALSSFWCGEAYSIGRKFDEATKHYLTAIKTGQIADKEVMAKAPYGLGYAYYNLKQYDRALSNFSEFIDQTDRKSANYTDALIRLADCYYVSKSYPEALDYYTRARNIGSPDNDYILLQSGVIAGIQRKYGDARAQLSTLISSYPKSQYRDDALFQRAQFEIEQGNYQQAVDGLTQLMKESPNSSFIPYAYMRRAAASFNLKEYDRTVNDYAYILKEYPSHPVAQDALLPLQEALNLTGKSGEFDDYLALFKRSNPDSKGLESIEFETAKNLFFSQEYQKAVTNLNAFVSTYPQSGRINEARYYTAESYYRLKDYDRAVQIYEDISSDKTLNLGSKIVGRIAEIDFNKGRYERAISSYHQLEGMASNKKDLYNAWSGLMESNYFLARYDSVNTYANLILTKGNVNASAQNKASLYLGKAAMEKGDYELAQDEFINTLNTARDEYGAEAKYLLGKIFYLKKEYKQCYETLVSLNNDFASYDAWVGKSFLLLADNFVAMGDDFQAKATLQSLIDHFPIPQIKEEAKTKLSQIEKRNIPQEPQGDETLIDTLENNR